MAAELDRLAAERGTHPAICVLTTGPNWLAAQ
jgi:hypothetical protein